MLLVLRSYYGFSIGPINMHLHAISMQLYLFGYVIQPLKFP